ncbi:MAG: hypothetical protein WED10_13375 [Brumimicrobium sp.]
MNNLEGQYKIIIQARNGSSRLPQKMVKPFYKGKTILQILIERLQKKVDYPIWLATTDSSIDDELVKTVDNYEINVFRGNEEDVFSRFTKILKKEPSNYFIRICGDNPFMHSAFLKKLINQSNGYDYTSFYDGLTPTIKTHYGIFGEVIRSRSLLEFEAINIETNIKEHVTPFLYENENQQYRINKISLPEELKGFDNLRLTVDTEEDFELAQELYAKHCIKDGIDYDLINLLNDIRKYYSIQEKMNQQIKQNSK